MRYAALSYERRRRGRSYSMITELIPVIAPSDAEQKAIAEMNSRFSQDATNATVKRLDREAAEARVKAPTKVAEIEREIARERELLEQARQAQENWARLKALKESE